MKESVTMSMKVLIIDDFEVIRASLKKILNQMQMKKVIEAVDGMDAIEKLAAENGSPPFDLIFLDWNMPRMNGLEFLLFCKKNDSYKNIPILMTTAEREKKSVILALGAGAADYIVKPFKTQVIQAKVEKYSIAKKVA